MLPLQLSDNDPDYASLQVGVHVLGAGGFDSRLLTRLRQKDGLSYGAGAQPGASGFEPSAKLSFYAIFAPGTGQGGAGFRRRDPTPGQGRRHCQ
ncbi:MAG: insulinase family protein [Burkholderiales bacterium]|nr:insulinase family protein [Burkholderiales bacterium]